MSDYDYEQGLRDERQAVIDHLKKAARVWLERPDRMSEINSVKAGLLAALASEIYYGEHWNE